jgi:hypothetical protein
LGVGPLALLKETLKTMDMSDRELIRSTGSGYVWNRGNIFLYVLLSAIITLNQEFSAFSTLRAKFMLVYYFTGCNIINKGNL